MKHIVSFEMAKAMKAAGYPQPEFATGQVWYNSLGAKTVIGRKHVSEEFPHEVSFDCFSVDSGFCMRLSPIHKGSFYAPSATEITHAVSMTENSAELYCSYFEDNQCWQATDGFQTLSEFHENPAEAAAELWLKLNAK